MNIFNIHNKISESLNYRSIKNDLISSNISNSSTPFYKPIDIKFKNFFDVENNKINMTSTHKNHLKNYVESSNKYEIFFRDGHLSKNDGNSVDIDVETTEMAKNNIMYNALTASLKKHSMIFKSIIDYNSKLN